MGIQEPHGQVNLLLRELLWSSFPEVGFLFGDLLPLLGALHNQIPLEIRKGAEDGEDQPSGGRVLDHAQVQDIDPHPLLEEELNRVQGILRAAGEAVQLGHDQRVPGLDLLQELLELGAVALRPRDFLKVDPVAALFLELAHLPLQILVAGAYPRIAIFHVFHPFFNLLLTISYDTAVPLDFTGSENHSQYS